MMKIIQYSFLALAIFMTACSPYVEDKIELGSIPNPSFTISEGATPNEFILTNTTDGVFITQWEVEELGSRDGEEIVVDIPFKGVYAVTMTTFNDGGFATSEGEIVVSEDDPNVCFGNVELLTNCGTRSWKLAPEAGALHVGPNVTDTWWGNSESDVASRDCHFNDEYIFSVSGEYEYKANGDFWADSDGNGDIFPPELGLTVGCHPEEAWPEAFKSWGSGIHKFSTSGDQLTVTGTGAWMGLYKVGTAAEVGTPQESVTLNILELTSDRMVLFADYSGVVWRFTFVPS